MEENVLKWREIILSMIDSNNKLLPKFEYDQSNDKNWVEGFVYGLQRALEEYDKLK